MKSKRGYSIIILTFLLFGCSGRRVVVETSIQPESYAVLYPETHTFRLPLEIRTPYPVLSIVNVGDIMLGNHTLSYLKRYGLVYPFINTRSILESADITIGNLEAPFTKTGKPFEKKYTFKVPPEYAGSLKEAGFDVVTLANNHICDYGVESLENTIRTLDSINISYCGAGSNLSEARKPAIIDNNGFKTAVFGYSMTYPSEFWATDTSGGTCYPQWNMMQNDIQKSDSLVDVVVVHFHWGSELSNYPKEYQKEWAHLAIDSGADLVIGHHPHVLQGMEIYKNRLIAYSLGNFSFSSYNSNATESVILQTYFSTFGFLYGKVIPIFVNNIEVAFQPTILSGEDADTVIAHLRKFSIPLNDHQILYKSGFIWGTDFRLFSKIAERNRYKYQKRKVSQ